MKHAVKCYRAAYCKARLLPARGSQSLQGDVPCKIKRLKESDCVVSRSRPLIQDKSVSRREVSTSAAAEKFKAAAADASNMAAFQTDSSDTLTQSPPPDAATSPPRRRLVRLQELVGEGELPEASTAAPEAEERKVEGPKVTTRSQRAKAWEFAGKQGAAVASSDVDDESAAAGQPAPTKAASRKAAKKTTGESKGKALEPSKRGLEKASPLKSTAVKAELQLRVRLLMARPPLLGVIPHSSAVHCVSLSTHHWNLKHCRQVRAIKDNLRSQDGLAAT